MKKTTLSENDLKLAYKLAYYYRYPERISEYEKALLNKTKADNPSIHYKALEINRANTRRGKAM